MAHPKPYKPAGLLIAVLAGKSRDLSGVRRILTDRHGAIEMESDGYPFTFTDYYEPEMGTELVKRFWLFRDLIDPAQIGTIKQETNAVELDVAEELGLGTARPVNLDPGLITPGKLLLASAKDFAGRVPIGNGLYCEVTLFYKAGSWQTLPWTFPDFASGEYDAFLESARRYVMLARKNPLK